MLKKKEETESLAHTKWNCKYHIVFAPKYRRQVIYGQIRADIGVIIRKLCEYKGVEIIEAEACPRSYPHARKSSTEVQCITVYGISQRKKFTDDIRQTRKPKVQIRKQAVLVQGVLCGHGRTEQKSHCGVYPKSASGRQNKRPTDDKGIL